MSDEAQGILILVVVGILVLSTIAAWTTASRDEHSAIAHSCAHYDSQTGSFRWNDEVTK